MYSSAFDSLVCYLLPRSDCMWSATLTSLQEKLWDSMFNWGKSAYFLHILQSFSFLSGWYLRRNLIINTGTCVTSELTKLIAKLTEESLWLSSRASDNGIRRSEVQFLTGTQRKLSQFLYNSYCGRTKLLYKSNWGTPCLLILQPCWR